MEGVSLTVYSTLRVPAFPSMLTYMDLQAAQLDSSDHLNLVSQYMVILGTVDEALFIQAQSAFYVFFANKDDWVTEVPIGEKALRVSLAKSSHCGYAAFELAQDASAFLQRLKTQSYGAIIASEWYASSYFSLIPCHIEKTNPV